MTLYRQHKTTFFSFIMAGCFLFFLIWFFGLTHSASADTGSSVADGPMCKAAIVPCGNSCDDPTTPVDESQACSLCHFVIGVQRIIEWGLKILPAIALLFLVLSGVLHMLSAVNPEWLAFSYRMLTTTLKGVMLTLVAWVIISSILGILAKNNLGVEKASNWHTFSCKIAGTSTDVSTTPSDQKCEVESISVQCETGSDKYIALSSDGKDKPDHYQLKAMATMKCKDRSGKTTTTQEDITSEALWEAADQTVVKMDKGMAATSAKPGVTEVAAEYQGKLASLQVYVDMCPLKLVGTSDPNIQPVSFKTGGASHILGETASAAAPTCTACPSKDEETTCHFVAGNKDAENIIVFAKANGGYACGDKQSLGGKWGSNSTQEQKDYVSRIQKTGEDLIKLLPPDVSSSFAVYRSDQTVQVDEGSSVYGKDANCPSRRFVSYGYVFAEDKEDRACASIGLQMAFYGPKDSSDARVVAHEQIGHAFGTFDDEYADNESWNDIFSHGRGEDIYEKSLNCFSQKFNGKCHTWNGLDLSCTPGCQLGEKSFYRISENGIMSDYEYPVFDNNQQSVLSYRVKNGSVPAGSWLKPFHCVSGCVSSNHFGITNIPFSMKGGNLLDFSQIQVNFSEGNNSLGIVPPDTVYMEGSPDNFRVKHKDPSLRDRDYSVSIQIQEGALAVVSLKNKPAPKEGRESVEDVFKISLLYKTEGGKVEEYHPADGDILFSVFIK